MTSLIQALSPAGVAVAASFAAYLVGSLTSALMESAQRLASIGSSWILTYDRPEGVEEVARVMKKRRSRFSRYKTFSIWQRSSKDSDDSERSSNPLETFTTLYVPRRSVPFESIVEGWGKDLCGALERVGLSEDIYWQALGANVGDAAGYQRFITLMLAVRVYEERELIADGLLDEKSELYGVIDRLRGEIELRDAIVLPLLALTIFLAATNSLFWLLALAPVIGLQLHRWNLEQKRLDRILAAISWKPTRAPMLKRIEREVQSATKPAARSQAGDEDSSSRG